MPQLMKAPKAQCPGSECPGCSSASCYAKGGEVGVNKTTPNKGQSEAGAKLKPAFELSPEFSKEAAKDEHRKTLSEMQHMKKPELMAEGGKLGSGSRFKHLEHSLAHEKGIHDPAALAASIGRKKYGAEGMGKLSHHEHLAEGGSIQDGEAQEDEELHHAIGGELMDALEKKDKKGIMSALTAAVMECMKGQD